MTRWLTLLSVVMGLSLVLGLPLHAFACPSCQAAIDPDANPDDDDPQREARAYAASIYLMLGMPYLLLGVSALMIYRLTRHSRAATSPEQPDDSSGNLSD